MDSLIDLPSVIFERKWIKQYDVDLLVRWAGSPRRDTIPEPPKWFFVTTHFSGCHKTYLILWCSLYSKLNDGSTSTMKRRHLILTTIILKAGHMNTPSLHFATSQKLISRTRHLSRPWALNIFNLDVSFTSWLEFKMTSTTALSCITFLRIKNKKSYRLIF